LPDFIPGTNELPLCLQGFQGKKNFIKTTGNGSGKNERALSGIERVLPYEFV
jgi:hypothetical protein